MQKSILVLLHINDGHREVFRRCAPDAEVIFESGKTATPEQVRRAEVIIGNPGPALLQQAENLKLLQLFSAGIGRYADPGVLPPGVILANGSGAFGLAISEHMIGALLLLYKRFHVYRDNQTQSKWQLEGKVKSIWGSTALIVGAGDIGSEFGFRMKALGAYTVGVRRTDLQKPDYFDEMHTMDRLEELLPRADVVALSLPETPKTRQVINRRTLDLMKDDAVLINVGRGSAVDTEALCDTLESGRLLGAALDVTDPEPLPPEHRLWRIKNAFITPHSAGGTTLPETEERLVRICAGNLEAYLNGRPLRNIVDRNAGY